MGSVPSSAHIRAQVEEILGASKGEGASRIIGIRAPLSSEVGERLQVGELELEVVRGRSVLEVRQHLAERRGDEPLLLLTPLEESELGSEVVARLARRHLVPIEPWQLVRRRFDAGHIDPRVTGLPWVARALLDLEPATGWPPAPGGFLTAELVWSLLFEHLLGLPGGRRDPESLLAWAETPAAAGRLAALGVDERSGLEAALVSTATDTRGGELARRIFVALATGRDALAAGLAMRVISERATPDGGRATPEEATALKAAGRLENHLGLSADDLPPATALAWAAAAEAVVEKTAEHEAESTGGGKRKLHTLLERGDALVAELGAAPLAHRSHILRSGYDQRLETAARRLEAVLDAHARARRESRDATFESCGGPALLAAARRVREHLLADRSQRAERLEMALRLARWLFESDDADDHETALVDAARRYRQQGGFVDLARAHLWGGDPEPALKRAYTRLSTLVGDLREAQNQRFGELFARWTGHRDSSAGRARVLGVEEVLDAVVKPLAQQHPILLVVIDGMSMEVFRQLQPDLSHSGWSELRPDGEEACPPVLAAIPAVSEVSRASLLSGRLCTGKQPLEGDGFSTHPGLLKAGRPRKPPRLFHKAELEESSSVGLSSAIEEAVRDRQQHVVAVVINAVDDLLGRGEQVHLDWRVEGIRPLPALLEHARAAGRTVILLSDHGHVLEHRSEKVDVAGAGQESTPKERWREALGEPGSGEILVAGDRVLAGGGRVIVPWSERLRYVGKKKGYHGGVAPQEVVIPLAVLVPGEMRIEGWSEIGVEQPGWWNLEQAALDLETPHAEARPRKRRSRPARSAPKEQASLFPADEWIDRLLESETLAAQRQQTARVQVTDQRLRAALAAFDAHGGKLTVTALARRLELSEPRTRGLVSVLRRLLNLDGYPVLSVEEASDTVVLDRPLLLIQFGLDDTVLISGASTKQIE